MFYINRPKKLIYRLFIYMNKVKKLIRETINELLLSEVAVTATEVLGNPDMGLINDGGSLVLYDFKNNRVFGTMSYRPASRNINQFVGVAAEKGYGPLIYELGIMSSFNKGLVPTRDGDIRDTAFSVWEKFINRSDVHKAILEPGDEAYSEEYDDYTYNAETDEEVLNNTSSIANTVLVKIPTKEFKDLVNRGKELMDKYRISQDEIKGRGGNFFAYKYADS